MSKRRDRCHAVGLCLSLLTWSAPAPAAPLGDVTSSLADDYFRQGKRLVQQGRLEDAYQAYLSGYRLKKGYDLAGNLGSVELELGLPRDAAEHLAFCIKNFPATGAAKKLEFIQGRFAEARKRVAALSITVSATGAEVFIDARSLGRSPLPEEVFVEPGERLIEVQLGGYELEHRAVEVGKGDALAVAFALKPIAPPPPPPSPPPPQPAPPPTVVILSRAEPAHRLEGRSSVPLVVGVSMMTLGVGVGFAAMAGSNERAARSTVERATLAQASGLHACLRPENQARCDEIDRTYLARDTLRTLSILGFATAGAASIATLVYYTLLPGERSRPAVRRAATPASSRCSAQISVAPAFVGFGLMGCF